MAASSLSIFTLTSRHYTNHHRKKSPNPETLNSFKTHFPNTLPFLSHHPKLRQPHRKLHISSELLWKSPLSTFFSPPQNSISNFYVEKIATLLLGSLILIGCSKLRPVLANPVQQIENLEEKISDIEEEEVMCVKLLEENPRNIETLKMVVNVKMRKGKTGEAVDYVERLIKLQPNEMEWRLLQALCYEMKGNLSKAKSLFKNVLKQKPLLLRALHGLAMVMHKNHEGPAVFEMLEKALQIAQREKKVNEERNIRILVAQMHIVEGNLKEALENFQALIDENPRDFRPYLCQGIVYSLLEKTKEAEENFEIYRSLVPEEFPERGFLNDVVLAAKTESKQQLQKGLKT
ncbi:hypothetical protein ABFS83_08G236300 [Erythranthe nasuta]